MTFLNHVLQCVLSLPFSRLNHGQNASTIVLNKHPAMSMKMESYIIDTIIEESPKHSGSAEDISRAVSEKLKDQYGGLWNVIIIAKYRGF